MLQKLMKMTGKGSHVIEDINLLRYIDKEKNFYIYGANIIFPRISDEYDEAAEKGILIRICNGKNILMIGIQHLSKKEKISDFQILVLEGIFSILKELLQNMYYTQIQVAFNSSSYSFDYEDIDDGILKKLIQKLKMTQKNIDNRLNNKTQMNSIRNIINGLFGKNDGR